jgi:mono/diheme cytochrome c family protein
MTRLFARGQANTLNSPKFSSKPFEEVPMRLLKLSVVLSFALFLAVACTQTETGTKATPEPPSAPSAPAAPAAPEVPDEVALGESKFKQYCTKCHKVDGTGGKVEIRGRTLNAKNLTSDEMKKDPDSEYIETLEKGIIDEGMPSFEGELSAEEMKAVVKYIRERLQS